MISRTATVSTIFAFYVLAMFAVAAIPQDVTQVAGTDAAVSIE